MPDDGPDGVGQIIREPHGHNHQRKNTKADDNGNGAFDGVDPAEQLILVDLSHHTPGGIGHQMLHVVVFLGVGNRLKHLSDSVMLIAVEDTPGLIHHVHAVLLADGQVLEDFIECA
ncbi:hypothetical protein D3C81_1933650 [compost metagenome]